MYPFGLNSRAGDEYIPKKAWCSITSEFPALKRVKKHQNIISRLLSSDNFILDYFVYIVNESLHTSFKNSMNLIRVLLSSLKKSSCRLLTYHIQDYLLDKHDSFRHTHYFSAALDICQYKIGTPSFTSSTNKTRPCNCCNIKFNNKGEDFINIQRILRDNDTIGTSPPTSQE